MPAPDDRMVRATYTPNDVATYTMGVVDRREAERALMLWTSVSTLDQYMKPLLPAEVAVVLANTSQGKTAFMQFWARQLVKQIQQRQTTNEVIVYISWETVVEELGLYDLCGLTGLDSTAAWYGDMSSEGIEQLRRAAFTRAAMPLWVIGYSLKRRREFPAMTMAVVADALKALEDTWQAKPAIVFLDHLQRIDPENWRDDRRIQVLKVTDAIQRLARDSATPVVVGSQAGRHVLERTFKLPEIGDGQETSRAEQDADKVISLWFTPKTEEIGHRISELNMIVSERLMIMSIRKQRHAQSGQVFPIEFDPAHNIFTPWREGFSDVQGVSPL